MKKYLLMFLALALCVFSVPKLTRITAGAAITTRRVPETLTVVITGEEGGPTDTVTLTPEEYITGCLLAQIPVNYNMEALKAQAAAAFTYALRIIKDGKTLSDDPLECQPYFTPEQGREYYGDDYEKYMDKLQEAAAYGVSHLILYEGEPIYSVYHSVSAGRTQSAENVWGIDLPYLRPVESPWDQSYGNFFTENQYTTEMMRVKFLQYDRSITMPVDYELWFSSAAADESGYVISMRAGNRVLSGGELWRIIGLRSTAFTIDFDGAVFCVKARGCGHGVGMSQYGADSMARCGQTAEEILTYYYTGCTVEEVFHSLSRGHR